MSDLLVFFDSLAWWQVVGGGVVVGLALAMVITIFREWL